MNNRSSKQHAAIINKRNLSLDNAANCDPGFSCQGVVGEYLGYYLRCEVFARKLQHFYQKEMGHKKNNIQTEYLNKALIHFNLHFSVDDVKTLFKGQEGKRGSKSARQLRNGYLHQLSQPDKQEIESKATEHKRLMKLFLKLRIKA